MLLLCFSPSFSWCAGFLLAVRCSFFCLGVLWRGPPFLIWRMEIKKSSCSPNVHASTSFSRNINIFLKFTATPVHISLIKMAETLIDSNQPVCWFLTKAAPRLRVWTLLTDLLIPAGATMHSGAGKSEPPPPPPPFPGPRLISLSISPPFRYLSLIPWQLPHH